MKTIIGDKANKHIITQDQWALSLVRKIKKEERVRHAYLILEGVDAEGERVIQDIHLVTKKGSDDKKADIVYRDISTEEVIAVGESCASYTWGLTKGTNENPGLVEQLIALVEGEKERAKNDEINYVLLGKTPINNTLGVSLENVHSTALKGKMETTSTNSVSATLLRDGHNCYSWAKDVVKSLGLPYHKESWMSFFAADPSREVIGNHNGDNNEPTTKFNKTCLMM